jgi:hypothetical protein
MNKQNAKLIKQILEMAVSIDAIEQEPVTEVVENLHIFLRKNSFKWQLEKLGRRLDELEKQQKDMANMISTFGLLGGAIEKVTGVHSEVAASIRAEMAVALAQLDDELPTDPTRVPAQDRGAGAVPIDDPEPLSIPAKDPKPIEESDEDEQV